MLMTLDNFCTLCNSKSPCLMTELNWAFLRSGLLVSTIPPTRSILQCNLPVAIKVDSSLDKKLC